MLGCWIWLLRDFLEYPCQIWKLYETVWNLQKQPKNICLKFSLLNHGLYTMQAGPLSDTHIISLTSVWQWTLTQYALETWLLIVSFLRHTNAILPYRPSSPHLHVHTVGHTVIVSVIQSYRWSCGHTVGYVVIRSVIQSYSRTPSWLLATIFHLVIGQFLHVIQVVHLVFQYMKMLQTLGPQQRYTHERPAHSNNLNYLTHLFIFDYLMNKN